MVLQLRPPPITPSWHIFPKRRILQIHFPIHSPVYPSLTLQVTFCLFFYDFFLLRLFNVCLLQWKCGDLHLNRLSLSLLQRYGTCRFPPFTIMLMGGFMKPSAWRIYPYKQISLLLSFSKESLTRLRAGIQLAAMGGCFTFPCVNPGTAPSRGCAY